MKVLVTGASGFIGSYVVKKLLELDDIQVVATSTNKDKARCFDWFDSVDFIEHNISESRSDLFDFFKQPDVLIHLAWNDYRSHTQLFQIEKNIFENYYFIKQLSEKVKNINVVGSSFEYGKVDGCLGEEMEPKPILASSLAKDSLRKFILELNKTIDFNFKWIRPFYVYGDGQHPKSIFGQLDSAINNKEPIFNMSKGEQIRDYLEVRTLADYIAKISLQQRIKGVINCASGTPVSIRSLVENYINDKKANIKLNLGHYPYLDYEPMAFWADTKKMNMALEAYDLENR